MARPKKTLDSLPDDWRDRMLDLAQDGHFEVEIRKELAISNHLFYRWKQDEPEFAEALADCKVIAEAWWSALGRDMAIGKRQGNVVAWIFCMKNAFGWADRQDIALSNATIATKPIESGTSSEEWLERFGLADSDEAQAH